MKCPLCKREFETTDELLEHVENDVVCNMVAKNDIDGLLRHAKKLKGE